MQIEPGKPLTQEDVEKLLAAEMVAGLEYVYGADNIAAERDRNYDYYRGVMNDLPAPVGRSRVVEPTIANYIGLMKPSLLRIFTSGRNVAEYVSPKPELQRIVRLVTRFINDVVFRKDNRGELLLSDWAEDALVQKLGLCMYWWEERFEARDEILEGITPDQLLALMPQIEARGGEVVEHSELAVAVDGLQSVTHSLKVRTRVNRSKCCIDVIPPEEFVISRDARNLEDAILRAHRTGVMVGDLVRAGYAVEDIEDLPTYSDLSPSGARKYNRDYVGDPARGSSVDPMLRKVCVTRGILKCDFDGTGIKEWYVVAGGDEAAPKLLEIQPYNDQVGFADFCPEPMPHTIYGRCPADRLAGIQKIQTVLVRQANDNLFLSNTPQREVVMDWIIKPDQLINMAPGAPVLVKQPGAIREISIPFVADKALAMIQYYDAQAEITTGVGRNTAGLDPETLSNQSATASNNMMSAQQGRSEMIARIWAQGGMRKLFRGVFRCIRAYQDFARVVQIDGAPESIDPRAWDGLDDLDVNINTGLGTGNRERDFALLSGIAAEQKDILARLGPANPIVDLRKATRTLQLKVEAAGISYPENFFGDPVNADGSPWLPPQPPMPPPPPPPQPSPDTIVLAKVETAKMAARAKYEADKLALERETAMAEMASRERIAREKNYWDAVIRAEQLGIDKSRLAMEAAKAGKL
ncbi:MAG: portal protein [Rhodospirillaceae bacterium]